MDFSILSKMDEKEMLAELSDLAVYRGYLQTMSRFSSYSRRNIFLIYKQMPHASKLADFDTWKSQYGRTIIRGSTSIKIYAPIPQKSKPRLVEKIDAVTGAAMLDEKGKRIMEEVVIEAPPQFKSVNYMDISQTEGAPVAFLAGDVMGDDALRECFIDALKAMSLSSEMSDLQGMVRKIVHNRLSADDFDIYGFVEESIVYAVCKRFGVDVGKDTDFAGIDSMVTAETLELVCKSADSLITDIEGRFAVMCKERGLDPMTMITAVEVKPPPQADPQQADPEQTDAITEVRKEDLAELPQTAPQYTKELKTGTVAGVAFDQYAIKPLTQEKPENQQNPAEPLSLKYPPDTTITVTERNEYGYTRPELLPLNKDRAVTFFNRNMIVYALNKDNTEVMARYLSDIHNHNGIFGIAYVTWFNSREYAALSSGNPEAQQEAKFIYDNGNSFAVYQTEKDKSQIAYKSYEDAEKNGHSINRHEYSLVYTAKLPDSPSDTPEGLFMWVNAERLDNYIGRALAISDVLSIKKDEMITSYYANGRTFKELLSFVGEEGRSNRLDAEVANTQTAEITPVQPSAQTAQTAQILEQPPLQTLQQAPPPETPPPPAATDSPPPALPIIKSNTELYRYSAKEADEYGTMGVYEDSRRIDIDCAEVIAQKINENRKDGNSYDLETPAEFLLKEYGATRMMWVLSKHILAAQVGFSERSRTWANDFVNDETGSGDNPPTFFIKVHHAVLDAFVNQFRTTLEKKPSFNERMKIAKEKSEIRNASSG